MEKRCSHLTEWDDENFLLDDTNTTIKNCKACKNQISNWNSRVDEATSVVFPREQVSFDDGLESPDDSPLLGSTSILTMKEFHCHANFKRHENKTALIKLQLAAGLCFLFMVAELIGGYIAGSLAIMTDAAHLFADLVGFLVSIVSIWMGRWPVNHKMTFGYARSEVLGALLSVLSVWLLAGVFCVLAIDRLWKGEYDINADVMLLVASLGLVVNILMGAVLHGVCHSHSNNVALTHSHHSNLENINIRAAAAHVLGDLCQSIGVLIAALIIKMHSDAKQADPICTIFFTVFVVLVTSRVARDSVTILLEASPRNVADIMNTLRNIQGVKHVHSLHVWTLAPGQDAIAAHLAVDAFCDRDNILNQATLVIKDKLSISSCTIQTETYNESLINDCSVCQTLYR